MRPPDAYGAGAGYVLSALRAYARAPVFCSSPMRPPRSWADAYGAGAGYVLSALRAYARAPS